MKNVTEFRKMEETGVDLRLQFKTLFWMLCSKLLTLTFQTMKGKGKQEPIYPDKALDLTSQFTTISLGIGVNKKCSV